LQAELTLRMRRNAITTYFPNSGPFRRELYRKHLEFFAAGAEHQERAFMGGNRSGKTIGGSFETTLHATGEYPDWWVGRRFDGPCDMWAAGDTNETTRDIIQFALLGRFGDFGTGMIPYRCLDGEPTRRQGIAEAVDTFRVKHKSGGVSTIGLKSSESGRAKFQGTAKHVIWLDEEPPADVYDECLMRLMTTDGIMMCTFTPLKGLSEVALRFLPHMAPANETGDGS